MNTESESDAITTLSTPTFYGRPNVPAIFQKVLSSTDGDVGVFFCKNITFYIYNL